MERLLKRHFGYDNFRPMQKEIIDCIINNKDTLAIMPTGGGKSLCYQIPALKFQGVTLVISPLISLMKDQVDSLKANGIGAEFINSSLEIEEISIIQQKVLNGQVKLLYISPERLFSKNFQVFLGLVDVSLIAIDEAHCISEWGHDFRTNYRELKKLKSLFPGTPLIALTATATSKVREDIIKQLSLDNPQIFISSFDRPNLDLVVIKKKDSFEKILNILKKHKEDSCIIYCFSRKEVESISERLNSKGFLSLPYHAGLSKEKRKQNQDLFIKDKIKIIVATIAFGMGIDKPDIRLVIHHSFSKSLESYYQEIGRAGRDGIQSKCILFYSYGDKRKHEFFLKDVQDEVLKNTTKQKLKEMMEYCESTRCRRRVILGYFGENYNKYNCSKCDVCSPELLPDEKKRNLENFKKDKVINYEKELFEKLRALRKKLAIERKVPPYVIFNDVSLTEMASLLPKNYSEFLEIKGVGEHKLEEFGEIFLEVIKKHVNGKEDRSISEQDKR